MATDHTTSGLLKKRAEIAGKIEYTQRQLNELIADLDHVDHVLHLLDPEIKPGKPKQYPPRHQAFRGEMQRFVLQALKDASKPVTSLEIALGVVKSRGLDPNDARTVSTIRKRVGACLFKLKRKGVVREVPQAGEYKGWERVG